MSLTFFHGHGSPYSWRVWLSLELLGLPYELKVLSFSEKDQLKPEFLAVNPRHQVPAILHDGFALWESVAILEYLDEIAPAKKLFPGDAKSRARIRRLIHECKSHLDDKGLGPIFQEAYMKPGGAAPDEAKIAKGREVVISELGYFARQLQGAFLSGDAPSAADFALYAEVAYVKRMGSTKPVTGLAGAMPTAIAEWAARVEALPYFDKTFPPHWRG